MTTTAGVLAAGKMAAPMGMKAAIARAPMASGQAGVASFGVRLHAVLAQQLVPLAPSAAVTELSAQAVRGDGSAATSQGADAKVKFAATEAEHKDSPVKTAGSMRPDLLADDASIIENQSPVSPDATAAAQFAGRSAKTDTADETSNTAPWKENVRERSDSHPVAASSGPNHTAAVAVEAPAAASAPAIDTAVVQVAMAVAPVNVQTAAAQTTPMALKAWSTQTEATPAPGVVPDRTAMEPTLLRAVSTSGTAGTAASRALHDGTGIAAHPLSNHSAGESAGAPGEKAESLTGFVSGTGTQSAPQHAHVAEAAQESAALAETTRVPLRGIAAPVEPVPAVLQTPQSLTVSGDDPPAGANTLTYARQAGSRSDDSVTTAQRVSAPHIVSGQQPTSTGGKPGTKQPADTPGPLVSTPAVARGEMKPTLAKQAAGVESPSKISPMHAGAPADATTAHRGIAFDGSMATSAVTQVSHLLATHAAHDLSANRDGSSPRIEGSQATGRGDVFAAMDAESAPGAAWIHIGPQRAEAGYLDPALGWVGVRADATGSALHASIVPATAEAAQALGTHLAGLNAYMAEHHAAAAISVSAPESAAWGTAADAGQGMGPQNGGQHDAQREFFAEQGTPVASGAGSGRFAAQPMEIAPMGLRNGATISLVA